MSPERDQDRLNDFSEGHAEDGGAAEYHAGEDDGLPWDRAVEDPETLPLFDDDVSANTYGDTDQ